MTTPKKPWPTDAVIVVCATPETAVREQMDSVHPCECLECGKPLVADGYTLGRAASGQFARGRPTKFLCVECFARYDFSQVTHHEDHRGHKEGRLYQRRTIRLPFGQAIEEVTEPCPGESE